MRTRKKTAKTPVGVLVIIVILVVAIAIYLGCCAVASASTKMLSGVSVAGIDISGLTYDEAKTLLESELGTDDADPTLRILFPSGELQVAMSQVMDPVDVTACLDAAWNYGHGSFLTGGMEYIRSLFGSKDFAAAASEIDQAAVTAIAQDAAERFSIAAVEPSWQVAGDQLLISMGSTAVTVDAQKVSDLIINAFQKMDMTPITYEAPTPVGVDLTTIHDQIYAECLDASFDDTLQITPEVIGVDFDQSAAQSLLDSAAAGESLIIPLVLTEPAVTAASLSATLCTDVLAEYSTYVTNNSNRNNNIDLACQACDGLVLMPGDVFSYNDTLGERTTARGYLPAGAYANGEVVDEVGGGICQVSSTLYLTALLADLEIVDRTCHMFVVSYVPYGMDATVNWGTIDFKFRNDTEHPIKIEAELSDGMVHIRLLGTKTDSNYVKMTYDILAVYPFETVEEEDPSIEEGKTEVKTTGSTGYSVKTYRNIYDENDNLISSAFEASSYYTKRDKVVLVPVGTLEPEEPEPPAADPENPEDPNTPAPPETPADPETPTDPETPVTPETPTDPEAPVTPETPTDPEAPVTPETPTDPGGAQSSGPEGSDTPTENP